MPCIYFLIFYKFIYLFIFGCFGSSLLHVGFLQLQRGGPTLGCGAWACHCGGFSCCGARALGTWSSVGVARGFSSCGLRALESRFSSCGARAQLLRGMWDLPGPGLEPVSPALVGRFLTTELPGKPLNAFQREKIKVSGLSVSLAAFPISSLFHLGRIQSNVLNQGK